MSQFTTDAIDLLFVMVFFCAVIAGLAWLIERKRKPPPHNVVHMRDWRHRHEQIERLEVRDSYWK